MGYSLRIFREIKQEFSLGLSNKGKRGIEKCSPFPHPLVFRFLPHPFDACHTQVIISDLYGPLTETISVTVFLSSGIEIMIFARTRLPKMYPSKPSSSKNPGASRKRDKSRETTVHLLFSHHNR